MSVDPEYFVALYRREADPWRFETSEYEREKYAKTLSVLRPQYRRAVEVGCSIGVFTRLLADRCDELIGLDVSPEALSRASKRCATHANVSFLLATVPEGFPQGPFDLVTVCEVGFYLCRSDLLELKERVNESLVTGGHLILVHWTPPVNGHAMSAEEVHETFSSDPRLLRTAHYQHETYVLDLFEKLRGSASSFGEALAVRNG